MTTPLAIAFTPNYFVTAIIKPESLEYPLCFS